MWTNEYGDKEREEKVRKVKVIHHVRDGFLNAPSTSVEEVGITREKEGERKRRAGDEEISQA